MLDVTGTYWTKNWYRVCSKFQIFRSPLQPYPPYKEQSTHKSTNNEPNKSTLAKLYNST